MYNPYSSGPYLGDLESDLFESHETHIMRAATLANKGMFTCRPNNWDTVVGNSKIGSFDMVVTAGTTPQFGDARGIQDWAFGYNIARTAAGPKIAGEASLGLRVRPYILTSVRDDTAAGDGGDTDTIELDAGASAVNDFYNGMVIAINGGTGDGQVRTIIDYVGATKIATLDSEWDEVPDATSEFIVSSQTMTIGYYAYDTAGNEFTPWYLTVNRYTGLSTITYDVGGTQFGSEVSITGDLTLSSGDGTGSLKLFENNDGAILQNNSAASAYVPIIRLNNTDFIVLGDGTNEAGVSIPKGILVGMNSEKIEIGVTDDMIDFIGAGGSNNCTLRLDLDEADGPKLSALVGTNIQLATATKLLDVDLVLGTTTGTKIGTAVGQKLGFWNAAPVVQPSGPAQAEPTMGLDYTGTDTVDQAAIEADIGALLTHVLALRAALAATGLIKGAA